MEMSEKRDNKLRSAQNLPKTLILFIVLGVYLLL